jgi:hypothetical protein
MVVSPIIAMPYVPIATPVGIAKTFLALSDDTRW